MTKDIVAELLDKIQKDFKTKSAKSELIREKILAIENKSVRNADSNEFAIEIGKIFSDAFKGEIRADILLEKGKMMEVVNLTSKLMQIVLLAK